MELHYEQIRNRHALYSYLDTHDEGIAAWITPLVFAGHLQKITWVKPVWAHQIPVGSYSMAVGVDKRSHCIRTDCCLPYFLHEGLYTARQFLFNCHTVQLEVVEKPGDIQCSGGSCIVDIDLDYFGTMNPAFEGRLCFRTHVQWPVEKTPNKCMLVFSR